MQRLPLRALALALALAMGVASPAQATVNQFVLGMRASGTTPFDDSAGPGRDAASSDDVVRTHDSFVYRVGYSLAPADSNRLITVSMGAVTMPAGYSGPALSPAELAHFSVADLPTGPNGCSNIQSTPVPWPPAVGTTTSGVSADGQHIVCYQAGNSSGSNMDFTARVGGAAPNGTTIAPPAVSFQSTNNPRVNTPTILNGTVGDETFYGAPTLKVSAAPRWQAAKKAASNGAMFVPGSGPGGENGYILAFNIGVYAQGSRKGLEALQPDYSIAEEFNDADMPNARLVNWDINVPEFSTNLPMGSGAEPTHQNGCGDWRTQLRRVGNYFDNGHYGVNDWGDTSYPEDNARYTVARGGTCMATAIDNTTKTATLALSGTDFSLQHYPTVEGATGAGGTLVDVSNLDAPTNQWWVASKSILIWVPPEDLTVNVQEFLTNKATLHGTSVTGQPNMAPVVSAEAGVTRSTDGGHSKIYTEPAVWTLPAGERPAVRDPNHTSDNVVNQASAGQLLAARLSAYSYSATDYGPGYFCEKIDNTRLTLVDMRAVDVYGSNRAKDPGTGLVVAYQTGSAAATPVTWALGVGGTGTSGGTWSGRNTALTEYAPGPITGGAGATAHVNALCEEGDIAWYPSIAALELAGHNLGQVTRVRGSYNSFQAATQILAFIPLRVLGNYAYSGTDTLPGGGTISFTQGQSTAGAIVPNQSMWLREAADSTSLRRRADALRIVQTEYAQITKRAAAPHNTNGGQVSRGAHVTYELQVNLSSSTGPGTADVEVWDVLPRHVSYLPGSSRWGGASIPDPTCSPPGVTPSVPERFVADSVAPGFQACLWTLPNQPVVETPRGDASANLPLLTFEAVLALGAPPGAALLNTSFADSSGNLLGQDSGKAQYQGATRGFQCKTSGSVCSFGNWTLNVSSAAGIVLNKNVNLSEVPVDTGFAYALEYAAVGTTLDNLRILDVLPFNGDERDSRFSGSLRLSGPIATPVAEAGPPETAADPDLVVLYTVNVPGNINSDPYHASHNTTGTGSNTVTTTNWCTVAQFGSAMCPADAGAATAFMALPRAGAGGVMPANTAYRLRVPVVAMDNIREDQYSNHFAADSPSLSARRPGSNVVVTKVVMEPPVPGTGVEVSGRVYREASSPPNGKDDGPAVDPGIAGVAVRLVCIGPAYDRSVSTDADGSYRFTDVPVGALCTLTETQPSGYANAYNLRGPGGTADGHVSPTGDSSITLTVPAGGSSGNSFAETGGPSEPPGPPSPGAGVEVSGRVYREASLPPNGKDDGPAVDPGIAGVTVRMVCTGPAYEREVKTDAEGHYAFTDVPAGAVCTLTETQPSGYANAYNLRGPGGTADGHVSPTGDSSITLRVPAGGSSGNSFAETAVVGNSVVAIPTLQDWLLGVLAALLGGLAVARRRWPAVQ